MVKGTNGSARFTRFADLPETAASGFVLAEGVPPTAQELGSTRSLARGASLTCAAVPEVTGNAPSVPRY